MSETTFISGEVDLSLVALERREGIRQLLIDFYRTDDLEGIYYENFIAFEEQWNTHEDTDEFMYLLTSIAAYLDPKSVARLMCEGETHNDYWSAIIKKNKVYIQRYKLKPASDKKAFVPILEKD